MIKLKGVRVWSRGEPEAEYGRIHRAEDGHELYAGDDNDDDDDDDSSDPNDNSSGSEALFTESGLDKRLLADYQLQ